MGPGNNANIKAVITAEDRASKAVKGFGDNVEGVGHRVAGLAKAAGIALAAAGTAAVAFGAMSVKAYMESENVLAQLNATLKSTGGAAGVTSDQAVKLSQSLQKVTRFSDEAILGGENLLLTFTSIGKDIFPQATEIMLDMSQALGQDLKSSAIQLGKALQDPIRGVTALRRVGVNFNDAQIETITKLVESNRLMDAQKLILKELNTEFGGSAKAAGKTFAGQLDILKNSLNDVQETIGLTIVRGLTPFAQKAAEFVNRIDWEEVISRSKQALKDLITTIQNAAKVLWEIFGPSLKALFSTIQDDLIPALTKFWKEIIQPMIPVVGALLAAAIWVAINALKILLDVVSAVLNFLADHEYVVYGLAAAFGILAARMGFNAVVAAFNGGMDLVMARLTLLNNFLVGFGGFAVLAGAAVTAGFMIIDAANKARAAWDRTSAAVSSAGESLSSAIRKIQGSNLSPSEKARLIRGITPSPLQHGGPAIAGSPYIVGERGPELFVPQSTGRVVPNNQLGGGGGMNITIQAGVFMGSQLEARKAADMIMRAYKDLAGSKSMTPMQMLER